MDLTLIIYNGWCDIKPNQTQPNQTSADKKVMVMKEYSPFPKLQEWGHTIWFSLVSYLVLFFLNVIGPQSPSSSTF